MNHINSVSKIKGLLFLTLLLIMSLLVACGQQAPEAEPEAEQTSEEAPTAAVEEEAEAEEAKAEEAKAEEAEAEEAEAEVEEAEEAGSSDERGILRLAHPLIWGGKEGLDPASSVSFSHVTVFLYDRLVRLDEKGVPAPQLATSWEANDDATEWTFTLQEGVTFHDGKPFTSADVAYTFEHILDPNTEAPLAGTLSLIEELEKPDDNTVVFNLNQGHADFPLLLVSYATAIIPEGSAETIAKSGIGTGAFKLEKFDATGTSVLVANEDYWQGKPGLAGIESIAIADAEARTLALQAGQIDLLLDLTSTQAELFADDEQFVVLDFPTGRWAGLVMRTDTAPFDDVRVRKAIRLAADRQQMIDLVLAGQGVVACDTPVWSADAYRWEGDCPQDIEQAKALLEEAGYADGIDVTLYASDSEPQLIPLAEIYQQQAAAAGINVELEIAPADSYWSEVWLVEPFITTYWQERPADQILNENWRSTAKWNESYFKNTDFDQLLDEARTELDFEKRKAKYQEAQQLLFAEGGHLIPYHANLSHAHSASVEGLPVRNWREFEWYKISKSE